MLSSFQDVIAFWYDEHDPSDWFSGGSVFDEEIIKHFASLHQAAMRGELFSWRDETLGRLAEIIVLDQFTRNIMRGTKQAFACDSQALVLAQEACRMGVTDSLPTPQRMFFYMPYMHAESRIIQQESLRLFAQLGSKSWAFAQDHAAIIERFGRFPHRNQILGRTSSDEELDFLAEHGQSYGQGKT